VSKNGLRKGVCQCNQCHNVFHQSDVRRVKTERLGLEIEETVCPNPECGSRNYGLMDYRNFKSIENVYKIWEIGYIFGKRVRLG
jgi:hypothetical protein